MCCRVDCSGVGGGNNTGGGVGDGEGGGVVEMGVRMMMVVVKIASFPF